MSLTIIDEDLVLRLQPALTLRFLGDREETAKARQKFLLQCVIDAYLGRRRHRSHPDASTFDREYLREGLRSNNPDEYLDRLFDFPRDHSGYHVGNEETKHYKLRPSVSKECQAAHQSALTIEAMTAESPPILQQPSHVQKLGIPPVLTEITRERVLRAMQLADREGADAIAVAHLRHGYHAVVESGGLPNLFADRLQTNGRLIPVGLSHLVTMPRRARTLLLSETGWWDYDLVSCHLSVFVSLGQVLQFPTQRTQNYLAAKDHAHRVWSSIVGAESDVFKQAVICLLNGGQLSSSQETSLGRLLGKRKAAHWKSLQAVRALADELREGRRQIISQARGQQPGALNQEIVFGNAVGSVINVAEARQYSGAVISHLLTGYEQWVIRRLVASIPSVKTVCYDGWIGERLTQERITELLEGIRHQSREELGVELKLQLKGTSFPTPQAPQNLKPVIGAGEVVNEVGEGAAANTGRQPQALSSTRL